MSNAASLRLPSPGAQEASTAAQGAVDAPQSKNTDAATTVTQSYKVEVIADNSGQWVANGVRVRTKAEAKGYAPNLADRWLEVRKWRVAESDDSPNYAFANGELTHL